MDREQAREYIKEQLLDYLHLIGKDTGKDTKKKFLCLNPAHNDHTPSMNYDKKRNKAHCFVCGADYDTLDIIGAEYNIQDPGEIFKQAHEIFNITIDGETPPAQVYQNPPKSEQKPPAEPQEQEEPDYTSLYRQAHKDIGKTDYPQSRGLTEEIINRFNIGFISAWRHPKAPATVPTTPRLIIPTSPHSYLARDTRPDIPENQQKYSKSKVGGVRIFNSQALTTAQKPIFITEGELDALSIISVGGEAIATGSTANKYKLKELLKSQKPQQPLIIAMDNDPAGETAAHQLEEILTELEITSYRANLYGQYKDANELLQENKEALRESILGAEQAIAEAEQEAQVKEAAEREAKKKEYLETSAAHYMEAFISGIKASVDTPNTPTGFKRMDEVLDGGLYEGLYVVGAISSLGKTTFIVQIADQIAKTGQDILIFSLEMARTELMAKSISRHTLQIATENGMGTRSAKTTRGITTGKRYHSYKDEEIKLINSAMKSYQEYASHIFISEGMGEIGVAQVRASVKEHIRITGNKPVVVIDYLQILAPHNERGTDKQNTDKAVMELKRISRDFKIPVIAVSSFNRANYSEPVSMQAFKESGAVEYPAIFLWGCS